MCYEWSLPEDVIKPKDNSIIGHIVARLLTLMNPPTVSNFRFIVILLITHDSYI